MKGFISSDSWFAGFSIWYMYQMMAVKDKQLDNKTIAQYLLDIRKLSFEEAIMMSMGKFTEFTKTGILK
jgi:hypothetical protein